MTGLSLKRASLKLRSLLAALVALTVFIPLAALTLEQAFVSSLTQSMRSQLSLQNLMLLSEFEFRRHQPSMPEAQTNDGFNIPDSGLYAYIYQEQHPLWRSMSSLGKDYLPSDSPAIGQERFEQVEFQSQNYFAYAFTAEFERDESFVPVTFYVLQDKSVFAQEVGQFRSTLWQWLGLVSLLLLGLLVFSLLTALRPLKHLIQQLRLVEEGKLSEVSHTYPNELEKLKLNLNHLLHSEQQQRERYKNTLGDLAHSLKTPLAVLKGQLNLPQEAHEPIAQLDNIIQRQLKRAVAGSGKQWHQAEPIGPVVTLLLNAMAKVYADKQLKLVQNTEANSAFYGDKTDLMELLGNLLDNGCKAAHSTVHIRVFTQGQFLHVHIDDDGPGIPQKDWDKLLSRGTRLDSYQSGQGIGMAVVSDLVTAYSGHLSISRSEWEGASIQLRFPLPLK